MSLDGIVIHALVYELIHALVGGRISKIQQPRSSDLLLHIRVKGINQRLLLSANHSYPRLYLTDENFTNPDEAPMFTMVLRKHIDGGIIQSIQQIELERIVQLTISTRDEIGDPKTYRLIIELMGRHSNIILVDNENDVILDGIHHVTPSISQYRIVLPGKTYVSPPDQGKLNPLHVSQEIFEQLLPFNNNDMLSQTIVQKFQGIGPLIAKEIVHRSHNQPNKLWRVFKQLMEQLTEHRYDPAIISNAKSIAAILPLHHIEGKVDKFNTINACLQTYYQKKASSEIIRQAAHDLLRLLNTESSKNKKKLLKLQSTLNDAQQSERYRLWGELLTSYQHQIQTGDSVTTVLNYYDENNVYIDIPLDPTLTPIENAQAYFKKYGKAKSGQVAVKEQIDKTKSELHYLDGIIAQIEIADPLTLEEIREELVEEGYIRYRKKHQKQKKKKKGHPILEQYLSSEGVQIFIGKNNIQNDFLTNRFARNNDTWLHTKDIPGSHVVISGEQFGEQTLYEAANLAAYYSKGRNSSSVPVDYTLIRHVRKPSGAKPGYVIYDHQKTLYVTPDEEQIQALKKQTT